jgi:import inner membrane translocase subunit TIM54
MSGPQPTPAPGPPAPPSAPGPAASAASSSKPALPPLTGFQSALEHTGIPRSVLTWKPRLPSRNWSIFLTLSGTLFYLYYDDRKQCRLIKEETIKKVEHMGKEVLPGGSLGEVRKIRVYGARCPEDGDDDRALRYFRKYLKVRYILV